MNWTTIALLAAELGTSRRAIERALKAGGELDTKRGPVEVEGRPVEPHDFDDLDITRRTTRLVRVKPGELAPDDIDAATEAAINGRGSTEATLGWLERIKDGEETRTVFTSRGDKHDGEPWSETARLSAGMNAQKLREFIDDRDRNWIERELVANALVTLATLLAERLESAPARLADQLGGGATIAEIRARLGVEIDEIRHELGDAAELHVNNLLGIP